MVTVSGMIKEYGTGISVRFVLRVISGIVFIVSGAAKMWDIYGFSNVVRGYGILPESLVVPVSIIIPFAEFVLGTTLLMNFYSRAASLLLFVMVIVFTGLSAMKYFSGNTSNSGCFGKLIDRNINPNLLVENAALVVALLLT
jgi:uncharacterized membrane protein YphA (DoxX/SURF4 family)